MHLNPRKIIPLVIIVFVVGAVYWYQNYSQVRAEPVELSSSGTIEATQVILASQIGGEVVEVLSKKGDEVRAGQMLVQLDDALLQAQYSQAQAALDQAQANYDLVAAGPADEQRQVAIAAAELELINAQQAIDDLYDKVDLVTAQAAKDVADGRDTVRLAERRLEGLTSQASQIDIDIAKSTVTLTEAAIKRAEKELKRLLNKPEDNPKRAAAVLLVSVLKKQHDFAVRRLNYLEGDPNEITLAQAEADFELAQTALEEAKRQYAQVKDGPDPDMLLLAEARLQAAQANLLAAQAEPSPEQLAVAESQIEVARSALGVVQAQMQKLALVAPIDGILLSRSVEPGEVVAPGAPLLTLAQLDDLTITVYVPEDRYGTINLGQTARMTVDSFPGEVFEANVIRIASQAEFTPRNVQTEEGRKTTVFAVELAVINPEGKLKPGMPADVKFDMGE